MNDTIEVTHPDPLPMVRVSGTHRNMGRQIGEACSQQVRRSLENARNLIESSYATLELTWAGAQIQARKYIPFVQERYPQYIEEMTGIAEGADVPIDDIIVLNAMEAVTMDALHLYKCTSLAINDQMTADGHILLAHNEDWLPEDEDDVYLIHATPDDEPAFLPARPEAQRQALLAHIPLGRLGAADDIAEAVAFLAGDKAAYITGTTLHVNGGMYMI